MSTISRLFGSLASSSRASFFSQLSLDEGEMKIKTSFEELTLSFEKGVLVICLGLSLDSKSHKFYLEQLQDLYDVILTQTAQEMSDYITQYSHRSCHLIISEPKDEMVIKEISDFPSVNSIFILSKNREMTIFEWIKASPKARVEKDLGELTNSLQTLISKLPKSDLPEEYSFQTLFLHEKDDQPDPLISKIANLSEYLNFKDSHLAKTHFISFARAIYKYNKEIEYIEKLEDDSKTILFLYSKQNAIFKLTNYCLKHEDVEASKCSRFIIKNLKDAIQTDFQSNLKKFNGLLYKGAYVSDKLWEQFSNHINQEIQIPEFFTVNKQQKPALEFLLRPSNDDKKILITIIMPLCISKKVEGFAEIKDSENVIFNLNSRFSVIQTTHITVQGNEFRHLVLAYSQKKTQQAIQEAKPVIVIPKTSLFQKSCTQCDQNNAIAQEYLYLDLASEESKKFLCEDCIKQNPERSPLFCVSPYLYQLSVPDVDQINNIKILAMAEDCAEAKNIPFYGHRCSHCQTTTDIKHLHRCLTCCENKQWCQDCAVECQRKCVITGHEIIVERSAYRFWTWTPELVKDPPQKIKLDQPKLGEEEEIKIYPDVYDYADENTIKLYSPNEQISIAGAYSKLAMKHKEFRMAVKYYEKAQMIRKIITKNKPHPLQIISLNELGALYLTFQNIDKAREDFNEALALTKNIYGIYHQKTIQSLINLETLYTTSGQILQAIETHLEILKIKALIFTEESNEFAVSCDKLASLYNSAQQPEKAVEFLLKASRIYQLKSLDSSKILNFAKYFETLGDISLENGETLCDISLENGETLTNYKKALEYYDQLEEKDPVSLAKIHKALCKIYYDAKDYQSCIQHSLKELEFSKIVYGDEHQKIANLCESLGNKYAKIKQYDKAVEKYLEAINLSKDSRKVKHLYEIIADFCSYQENIELENEYRTKAKLVQII